MQPYIQTNLEVNKMCVKTLPIYLTDIYIYTYILFPKILLSSATFGIIFQNKCRRKKLLAGRSNGFL